MKAHELLDRPGKWTKGYYATDTNYNEVVPDDPKACRWCVYGALRKCYEKGDEFSAVLSKLTNRLVSNPNFNPSVVTYWNDHPDTVWGTVHDLLKELDV